MDEKTNPSLGSFLCAKVTFIPHKDINKQGRRLEGEIAASYLYKAITTVDNNITIFLFKTEGAQHFRNALPKDHPNVMCIVRKKDLLKLGAWYSTHIVNGTSTEKLILFVWPDVILSMDNDKELKQFTWICTSLIHVW